MCCLLLTSSQVPQSFEGDIASLPGVPSPTPYVDKKYLITIGDHSLPRIPRILLFNSQGSFPLSSCARSSRSFKARSIATSLRLSVSSKVPSRSKRTAETFLRGVPPCRG